MHWPKYKCSAIFEGVTNVFEVNDIYSYSLRKGCDKDTRQIGANSEGSPCSWQIMVIIFQ